MTNCQICGRTETELEEEFGREIKVEEHEGMEKCGKCLSEYRRETGDEQTAEAEEVETTKDWKKAITA